MRNKLTLILSITSCKARPKLLLLLIHIKTEYAPLDLCKNNIVCIRCDVCHTQIRVCFFVQLFGCSMLLSIGGQLSSFENFHC